VVAGPTLKWAIAIPVVAATMIVIVTMIVAVAVASKPSTANPAMAGVIGAAKE
jgi:hypothetical protein